MGCYGTGNKKPNQADKGESSALIVGLKYAVDASLGLIVAGVAAVVIYYASCTPHEEPIPEPVNHTPIKVLDDIKQD